ncbi:putative sodium-dependent multivitamin transporter [Trichonephila clavipes]|nr:putative sodium-dependent multivitamin transporter [Trichonephila clavipes]
MNSSPVPLKTHRVGERCTLNLPRAQMFSRWYGVVEEGMPAQVSSSSLDHGSKSPKILFMSVGLYSPSIALSAVSGLSHIVSILAVGIVCAFYCTLGGMKAVLWTDVLQSILMFLALLSVIIKGSIDMGGFQEVLNIAEKGGRLNFFNKSSGLAGLESMTETTLPTVGNYNISPPLQSQALDPKPDHTKDCKTITSSFGFSRILTPLTIPSGASPF